MRSKNPRGISTIVRYIVSYTGVALLSCALIGGILFMRSTGELNRAYERAQRDKLSIGVSMLADNIALMQEAAYKIQFSYYFRPSFLAQDHYNPAIMLKYFAQYQYYVPMTAECFLYYYGTDTIYKVGFPTPASNGVAVYAKYTLNMPDETALYGLLNTLQIVD